MVIGVESFSYQLPRSLQFVNLVDTYNKKAIVFLYCIINGFVSMSIMAAVAMWSKDSSLNFILCRRFLYA